MRPLPVLAVLALATGYVHAQPGATPPPPPPPVYAPPPGPAPYVPPPHTYAPPAQLTPEEAKLLARGEISSGTHVAGGLAAFFLGLGVGHGIQGRWDETGWIFTVGELASIAAIIVGIGEGEDGALVVGGAVGLVVFRVWEVVDAFAGPARHNRRLRELRTRLGYPPAPYAITPFVAPPRDGAGGVAGVSVRF